MNSVLQLTANQLRQAADIQERIQELQQELNALLGSAPETRPAPAAGGTKRRISAAGIARIRAAQKARWAKFKGIKATARAGGSKAQPRRKMSPAAKARLAAIARARWQKAKAAGKSRL